VVDPVVEEVVDPVVEEVVEPVVEEVVEPVVEEVVEPVIEPFVEEVVDPVVEPVVEPVVLEKPVQEKHVVFQTFDSDDDEEINIEFEKNINNIQTDIPVQNKPIVKNDTPPTVINYDKNKYFSFNGMFRPVRHHLSKFKFF